MSTTINVDIFFKYFAIYLITVKTQKEFGDFFAVIGYAYLIMLC